MYCTVAFAEWLDVFARVLPLATFPLDLASSNDRAPSNSRAAFLTFASLRIPWPSSCVVLLVVEKTEAASILSIIRTVKVGP